MKLFGCDGALGRFASHGTGTVVHQGRLTFRREQTSESIGAFHSRIEPIPPPDLYVQDNSSLPCIGSGCQKVTRQAWGRFRPGPPQPCGTKSTFSRVLWDV